MHTSGCNPVKQFNNIILTRFLHQSFEHGTKLALSHKCVAERCILPQENKHYKLYHS